MAEEDFVPGSAAPNIVEFRSAQERDQAAEIRALSSVLIERFQFLRQAGITFGGDRDLYKILGYERVLTTKEYRDRYSRGGIAGRICDAFPNATWRGNMEIIEDENPAVDTPFEKAVKDLNTRLSVLSYFRRADILSQLGYYSVILLGTPGDFDKELPRATKPEDLKYITPFSGGGGPGARAGGFNSRDVGAGSSAAFGDATIMSFDTDAQSERFGQPLTYQLRRIDATNPDLQRPVHWSRVIHICEGALDNEVYGLPRLERVWNYLDDLDKCVGGGSEAFWIKANAGLHANVDKTMGLPGNGSALSVSERDKLRDQMEEYQHKINRVLLTRGVDVKELGSTPADFAQQVDSIVKLIAGALSMPQRILTGSEMGQLASSQDRDTWVDQVNGRQVQHAEIIIVRRFYNRLIKYGYLPTPKGGPNAYQVVWPHQQNLTADEKANGAAKWASVNATQGAVVFTENEIREHWYQMEPLTEEEESEGLSQNQKGQLAVSLAMTNKSMGVTVFTDDEIRDTTFGLEPLSPDQKLPIAAPERLSGGISSEPGQKTSPKQLGPALDENGQPIEQQQPEPKVKVAPQSVAQMHAGEPQKPIVSALETAIAFGKTVLDTESLRTAMASGDKETTAAVLRAAADAVSQALRMQLPEAMEE